MKRTALIACALLLVGCSAPSTDATPDEGTPSAASSAQPTSDVADAAPCQTLIGADGGLVSESARFLTDLSELDSSTAAEATALAESLEETGETTSADLHELLAVMQEPFRALAQAHAAGTRFSLDPTRFKAAAGEVIAMCEPLV
jgi:hypothetical protein